MNENKIPKVSIGLPVYNGEKFIKKRIENLLEQTLSDFELIISDNCSTDSTFDICNEFARKDSRIQCINQEKNMGPVWNFNFVLKKARGKYFLWVAVDDLLHPKFLEKNVAILDSMNNIVCSTSKIKMFGGFTDWLNINEKDSFFAKLEKRIKTKFSYMDTFSVSGNYESKISLFIKNCRHNQIFYGLYRREVLEKCIIKKSFIGFDTAYSLNVLKYGDFFVIDDIMMYVFDGGESRSGMIGVARTTNQSFFGLVFPYIPFTIWCRRNLGTKLFLKNIIFFIRLNCIGFISLSLSFIRILRRWINMKD